MIGTYGPIGFAKMWRLLIITEFKTMRNLHWLIGGSEADFDTHWVYDWFAIVLPYDTKIPPEYSKYPMKLGREIITIDAN